ncbi:hypothetical protein EDC96DRAFT_52232 [Choanephora cucurbitarum]|nr:hypothetical protein EDC96DRAFT_52232 [Choanephora cucurbitarum]
MSTSPSSDLLHVTGKDKKPELINPKKEEEKKTILDIPSLLAASETQKTSPLGGSSDILSRVQAFLPQMKEANEQLKHADPSKLDIENVDDQEQYIEMNLGLGVFEEKKDESDSSSDEDIEIPTAHASGKIEEI